MIANFFVQQNKFLDDNEYSLFIFYFIRRILQNVFRKVICSLSQIYIGNGRTIIYGATLCGILSTTMIYIILWIVLQQKLEQAKPCNYSNN